MFQVGTFMASDGGLICESVSWYGWKTTLCVHNPLDEKENYETARHASPSFASHPKRGWFFTSLAFNKSLISISGDSGITIR
jgi:hypothetical protein